jgi:predicted amidophosphoribosyltransferase
MGAWKERGLRPAARVAADVVCGVVPRPDVELITYIPQDGDRSLRRGHHPAQGLARELGARWQIPERPSLARTRAVARQTGLARAERARNMRDAFKARGRIPSTVALVDDVYTTGATVAAAASALRRAGAGEVHVITFARTVR